MEYTEIIIDDLYQLELGDKAILIPTTYELIDIKDLNRRSGSKTKQLSFPEQSRTIKYLDLLLVSMLKMLLISTHKEKSASKKIVKYYLMAFADLQK
jgi:hypothetical protein